MRHLYLEGKAFYLARAIMAIRDELSRAETLHPTWPADIIHQAAVVAEEAGELVQAANDHIYKAPCPERLRTEAVQVGAMAIRFLINQDAE